MSSGWKKTRWLEVVCAGMVLSLSGHSIGTERDEAGFGVHFWRDAVELTGVLRDPDSAKTLAVVDPGGIERADERTDWKSPGGVAQPDRVGL